MSSVPRRAPRYRCGSCGNLTRFDVVAVRRTKAFYHFSIAGDVEVEDEQLLDEEVELVTCRWCSSSKSVEVIDESDQTAERATAQLAGSA